MDKGTDAVDVRLCLQIVLSATNVHICSFSLCMGGTVGIIDTLLFQVLEGRSYRLQRPWIGIVNRSQADINRNVDMLAARRKEREYFATSPDYSHLSSRMGSEYLGKMLSKVCLQIDFAELVVSVWNRHAFLE